MYLYIYVVKLLSPPLGDRDREPVVIRGSSSLL